MHRTCRDLSPLLQLSRWLRIVSTATVVLPVWRSPRMSWRWPRPIGVMASMALMPVCSGSLTPCRWTTDGACSSSARRALGLDLAQPSSGSPSGSTTRPRNASPTGTERTSPVRRTGWPSSMPAKSPRTTTPISVTSRFRARPSVPSSNSSSSLAIAEGRPSTRAMPSPATETWPTSSRAAAAGSYDFTNSSSASRISSGRIVSSVIVAPCSRTSLRSVRHRSGMESQRAAQPALQRRRAGYGRCRRRHRRRSRP